MDVHVVIFVLELREIHFNYLHKGLHGIVPLSDNFSTNNEFIKGVLLSGVGTFLFHRNWDLVKGRLKTANVLLTRYYIIMQT